MLKKVIQIVISLCLIFSISVMAENTNAVNDETVPEAFQEMPDEMKEQTQGNNGNMTTQPSADMQNSGTPPFMTNGEIPAKGMNRGQRSSGNFDSPQNARANNTENATQNAPHTENNAENSFATLEENGQNTENSQFEGRMPGGMGGFPGNMQDETLQPQEEQPTGFWGFVKTYSTPIISVILLILAFFFVIFYRRKNY